MANVFESIWFQCVRGWCAYAMQRVSNRLIFIIYINIYVLSMYTMIGILLACSSSDQWRLVNSPVDVDDRGSKILYEDIF